MIQQYYTFSRLVLIFCSLPLYLYNKLSCLILSILSECKKQWRNGRYLRIISPVYALLKYSIVHIEIPFLQVRSQNIFLLYPMNKENDKFKLSYTCDTGRTFFFSVYDVFSEDSTVTSYAQYFIRKINVILFQ